MITMHVRGSAHNKVTVSSIGNLRIQLSKR